jgi:GDP-4-dehydro-6-deoxy-D-mannose reductase
VISCAGIVENSDAAKLNVIFTTNILQSVVDLGLNLHRIITLGSAGEYGIVEPGELPVKETNPLRGTSHYAVSKLEEVKAALRYRDEYGLPVVVARLFNPIGAGMPSRQLIPRIITRLAEIKAGTADTLEVNRLDAKRDYVDVRDVATAIHILLEAKDLRYGVYNVGSGRETSNRDLIECILQYSDLSKRPNIIETASESEPIVASCADISRLRELGWQPIHTTEEVIRETIYVSK